MSTEKKVNYPEAMVVRMTEIYTGAEDSEAAREAAILEIQEFSGKTVSSIRAKLGSEGIYIPKAKVEKKGKSVSKSDMVAKIQDFEPALPSGFFDSLETANKGVLTYVLGLQSLVQGYALEFDADETSG